MDLGKKILELRKKENLSQEQLAEKMNVTRQTISKWELNETTPDIKQAKELSRLFKISLDELTENDMTTLVMQKVSNTEKLAGLVLKVSKWLGVCFLITLVIDILLLLYLCLLNNKLQFIKQINKKICFFNGIINM